MIFLPLAQGSSSSASGTRVVLPAPGGATSTAALLPASVRARSSSTASIGSGVSKERGNRGSRSVLPFSPCGRRWRGRSPCRMRGLYPRERPLTRLRFAKAPSPTRGEGESNLAPAERGHHPVAHLMRGQKFQRRALQLPCTAGALRDRDQEVATMRHRDADCGVARATGHVEMIVSQAPGHLGNANRLARRKRCKAFADQIEIGNAIDFVVIGNAGVTIAEADFWPHIELGLCPA